MGTISDKLTYLNTTKGNIKDAINLTGANILSEDTFRSYADKLKQGLVDAINDGGSTIYSNFPKTTGTGTEIALNDVYEAPMEIGLNGNTHQDSYTGKNLFDGVFRQGGRYTTSLSDTNRLFTTQNFPIKSGVSYTISTTLNTSNYKYAINLSTIKFPIPAGTQYFYDSGWKTGTFTFTPSQDGFLGIVVAKSNGSDDLSPSDIASVNWQLEQGSSATSYEPYVGGIPSPNPDYPQQIEVVTGDNTINVHGKNLAKSYVNGESLNRYQPSLYVDADFEVGKKYAISFVDKSVGNSYYRNEYLMQNFPLYSITATGERQTYYFECKSNDKTDSSLYVEGKGFNIFKNYTVLSALPKFEDIQIEEVTSYDIPSTPYVPYQSKDYEINLKSKNLFDINAITEGKFYYIDQNRIVDNANWNMSDYIKVNGNTNYIVSYTKSTNYSQLNYSYYDENKNLLGGVGADSNHDTYSILTPVNAYYIRLGYRNNGDYILSNIQLEQGSTPTEYEKFYDYKLCKINDYKDKIDKSTGKNLFDISTQENSNINVSTGEITPYNNFWRLSDYIEVNSNTKYTISWVNETNAASYIKVAYYDSNKTFVSGVSSGLVDYIDSYEITTPANINYIRFAYLVIVNNTSAPKNNVQIEQNSQATDYEPYGEQWYIKKNIGKVVLDGTEQNLVYDSTHNRLQMSFNLQTQNWGALALTLCDHFSMGDTETVNGSFNITRTTLYFKNIDLTSLNDWKTWLGSNNTSVYYVLATPTYEIITNETLISQLEALEKAKSVDDKTFISQINEQLPFILDVSALSKN